VPDQEPLEDLLARLERERREADRAYNDALTALDRAIQSPPMLPGTPTPPAGRPVYQRPIASTSEGGLKARLRRGLWRILGSSPGMERRLEAALAEHANWSAAGQTDLQETIATLREAVGREFEAVARFESLLVQYLQTITLYVDTKDRSVGGAELRDRLALAEQRLMRLKREIEARSDEQSLSGASHRAAPGEAFAGNIDSTTYVGFEDRFRGARAEISRRVEDYLPLLSAASDIVDVGCGRGELLDLLHSKGIRARGVDTNLAMVELCRGRGRAVEHADALGYLMGQADATIGGLVAIQVVEHFDPGYLARFLETAYHKMRPGAPLILETINPACWMAFFETYIRDLTHQRPLHPDTLRYLVEASGFTAVAVQFRQPVSEGDRLDRVPLADAPSSSARSPELNQVASALNAHADKLNARLFSSMDYAVIARR